MYGIHRPQIRRIALSLVNRQNKYYPTIAKRRLLSDVAFLKSWDIDEFRQQAFIPQLPHCLPQSIDTTPDACRTWFSDVRKGPTDTTGKNAAPTALNSSFWERYGDIIVPLEITSKHPENDGLHEFEKIEAPLKVMLQHLSNPALHTVSIYLAQHDLRDLPQPLQNDLPTPNLVKLTGKGDVYNSSLWMGQSPTYTPLHRDPNPNLFIQLAGVKVIHLFQPVIGNAILEHAKQIMKLDLGVHENRSTMYRTSSTLRGEEMMQGHERAILHDLVWSNSSSRGYQENVVAHLQQATVMPGQALFIPKGWWHSVKGVGNGITASANWWFR